MSIYVPQSVTTPQNIGSVEVFGTSFSTQTQTVLIALNELGIKYIHHHTMPNSPEISEFSPFGTIPVLVHRPNAFYSTDDKVSLFEVSAICRYIDEVLNEHGTQAAPNVNLFPKLKGTDSRTYADSALLRAEIVQLCSVVKTYLQSVVEDRYVKQFFALRNNGATRADIDTALSENLAVAIEALVYFERLLHKTQSRLRISKESDFLLGREMTWVSVLLFPILRDFAATEPNVLHGGENERLPHLTNFLHTFAKRHSAAITLPGSFAGSVNKQ
ncbi:unnamed protein product [Malassezia sympodialis ATCC 42132]|uniref:Uncharacterized protein n=1 Tax=Malassezia sympodialis (strain ATCC 42132) TaxID=1230383 RepID=M5E5U7_MALS4|nr:uncharacterized protein MSY001_0790 [Malassezia sympodialis ATCC 42132]CCU98084.1 unnamed protein product [Malassezia sympodialis ATCC 42132]SHO76306.1 Uncharacterized protein MSYG_0644 [Malassezia sympodialis ATCC 42132]|eukprot:XP_018739406.1 uncharacterized protein MSY001_0790 [Malassezia sympodialis ATCC 42132]